VSDGYPFGHGITGIDQLFVLDRIVYVPFWWSGEEIDLIGLSIGVAEAGKNFYLGAYIDNDGIPTTKVFNSAALSLATPGDVSDTGLAQALPPGDCWLAALSNATGTARYEVRSALNGFRPIRPTTLTGLGGTQYFEAGSYASGLPATAGALTSSTVNPPAIRLGVA